MTHQMLQSGCLVSVKEIAVDRVVVRQLSGREMVIHFDIALPTPTMQAMLARWRKTLFQAAKVSAYIRMLGLTHVAGQNWNATESTVMLTQCNIVNRSELKIIESFAGGYGGWSKAVSYLNEHYPEYPLRIAGAIEWDEPTARMWDKHHAISHGCCCTMGNVTGINVWADLVNEVQPSILTVSSSCVQFSHDGQQLGWNSDEGHSLAATLLYASKSGIEIVLVEQVSNFRTCIEFWNGFVAIAQFCNYRIAAEGVVNTKRLHPANRARELIVLIAKGNHMDLLPHVLISEGCVPGLHPKGSR